MLDSIKGAYVCFSNTNELDKILKAFAAYGYEYKNKFTNDPVSLVREKEAIDKINFKDNFILTSSHKENTISYKAFINIVNADLKCREECDTLAVDLECEEELNESNFNLNTINTNNNMNTITAAGTLNSLRADKNFKDEKYLEEIIATSDTVLGTIDSFESALNVAADKAYKLRRLHSELNAAVAARNIKEIEAITTKINASIEYVTETEKVLVALNITGEKIIEANSKTKKQSGKDIMG